MKTLISVIAMLFCGLANATTPVASFTKTLTSGVAPLCFQVNGKGSTDAEMTGTNEEFRGLYYFWTFGDSAAGYFTNGAFAGRSKNEAFEPIAGHCYTTGGSKTINLTVCDETTCNSTSQTITVTAADSNWTTTKTHCIHPTVTPTAGADGCPAGASVSTTIPSLTGDIRVLLRAGQTFNGALTLSGTGPSYIGSYGSENSGRATITCSGCGQYDPFITGGSSAANWRVENLELSGTANTHGQAIALTDTNTDFAFIGLYIHGFANPADIVTFGSAESQGISKIFLMKTTFACGAVTYECGAYLYTFANDSVYQDNYMDGEDTLWFCSRTTGNNYAMVSNTCLDQYKTGDATESVTLRAPDTGSLLSQYVVYTGNWIRRHLGADGINVSWLDANADYKNNDYIISRNLITDKSGASANASIRVTGRRIAVRNNIIVTTNTSVSTTPLQIFNYGVSTETDDDINFDNNTIYRASAAGTAPTMFTVGGAGSNRRFRNNLIYYPGTTGGTVATGADDTTGTLATTGWRTDPFAATPSSTVSSFRLGAAVSARSAGTAVGGVNRSDALGCHDKNGSARQGALIAATDSICRGSR